MNKKYLLVALLFIEMTVISTMAFTITPSMERTRETLLFNLKVMT